MNEFMPRFAPVVVLFFLGTILILGCCFAALLYGAVRRSRTISRAGAGGALLVASFYLLVLSANSLTSRERLLGSGEWKYFCELDCHIAYSVREARQVSTLGPEGSPVSARGEFYIVRVESWFDPRSISPQRGDGPLVPNRRRVVLVDSEERQFPESEAGKEALLRAGGESVPLSRPLRPGESYLTDLVFDLPRGAGGVKLLLTEDQPESRFLVGHENSFLHRKIYSALPLEPSLKGPGPGRTSPAE